MRWCLISQCEPLKILWNPLRSKAGFAELDSTQLRLARRKLLVVKKAASHKCSSCLSKMPDSSKARKHLKSTRQISENYEFPHCNSTVSAAYRSARLLTGSKCYVRQCDGLPQSNHAQSSLAAS